MIFIENLSLCIGLVLCILMSKSDFASGIIENRKLLVFFFLAVALDAVYYGIFAKDLFCEFLLNVFLFSILSLYLFFSHSFAGGDCKMSIVLALLYPARFYVNFNGNNITLWLATALSIFWGLCYLFFRAIVSLLLRETTLSTVNIKNHLVSFIKNYVSAMIYVAALSLIFDVLPLENPQLLGLLARISCFILAWCVGKYPKMKSKALLFSVTALVVLLGLAVKRMPISLRLQDYVFVFALSFAQMVIKTIIYEDISPEQLKSGMILSTLSSALMQTSITKNLPGVSTEDLRSRLTSEEVEAVKVWARATHFQTISIVRKIPFAFFISIGFMVYFFIGGILEWFFI